MPVYHVTFFFSTAEHGWVEQLYRSDAKMSSALQAGIALAKERYKILGAGTVLHTVRVTQPDAPRAVMSANVAQAGLAVPSMLAHEVAEIRLEGGPKGLRFRSYAMHGLPRGAIVNPAGPARWSPSVATSALAYLVKLTQGWLMKVRQPVGGEIALEGVGITALVNRDFYGSPVPGLDQPEGSLYLIYQGKEQPLGTAEDVKVRGVGVSPDLPAYRSAVNGTRPIVAREGKSLYVAGDFDGADFASAGKMQLETVAYVPITRAFLTRGGARSVGRKTYAIPPDLPAVPLGQEYIDPSGLTTPNALVIATGGPGVIVPPVVTIGNALDLIRQIYTSYVSDTNPQGDYVQVAPVISGGQGWDFGPGPPVYAVLVSGLDLHRADTYDQQWGVFGAYVGIIDPLQTHVERAIRENTPDGCRLILAGHSMGGMQCEWMMNWVANIGSRQIINIVTYGSSASQFLNFGNVHIRRFSCGCDPCVWLGPVGWWLYPRLCADFASMGAPEAFIFVRELAGVGIYTNIPANFGHEFDLYWCHTNYHNLAPLMNYNWAGYDNGGIQGVPLILGPITRVQPVPTVPHRVA